MKKAFMVILLILIVAAIAVALHHTNGKAAKAIEDSQAAVLENGEAVAGGSKVDVVITDNFFIQSTNDVYLNLSSYIGKTIKIEGLAYVYQDYSGESHHAVIRNSPGCCGNDGLAGLDIEFDNYPEQDTWIEVIGTIKAENIDNQRVPVIEVTSMREKEAGQTFVTN